MLPIFGLSLFSWIVAILAITQNCPKNTVAACEPMCCRSVAACPYLETVSVNGCVSSMPP
jgi:hypothetical protein